MRVTFLGNADWSTPSLEALVASRHEVVLVVTGEPHPARRGGRPAPTPVARAARRLGVPLEEVPTVTGGPGLAALAASRPDVLAVVAYGEILPPAILDLPAVAPVNLHFSLLPELRGAAPVQRAILGGLAVTGVTTIRMDQGMDTGPVLLRREHAVDPECDAGSLGAMLAVLGARLLVDTVDRLESGSLAEQPQDDARASVAPKLRPAERTIDWVEDADRILRRIRACAPQPGATTAFRGRGLKVLRASVHRAAAGVTSAGGQPGTIVAVGAGGLAVAAADGVIELLEVAPEARRHMSGAEFARGYRPRLGERFG